MTDTSKGSTLFSISRYITKADLHQLCTRSFLYCGRQMGKVRPMGYTWFWTEHFKSKFIFIENRKTISKNKTQLTVEFWSLSVSMLDKGQSVSIVNISIMYTVINEGINLLLILFPVLVDRNEKSKCFFVAKVWSIFDMPKI